MEELMYYNGPSIDLKKSSGSKRKRTKQIDSLLLTLPEIKRVESSKDDVVFSDPVEEKKIIVEKDNIVHFLNNNNNNNNNQLEEEKEEEIIYRKKLKRIVKSLPQLSVEVMIQRKAMLNQLGELVIVQEPKYALVEKYKEIVISPLQLYLLRDATAHPQERPMMPCVNSNFLKDNQDNKHGYEEPIRDRDKNWREILWTTIAPGLIPFEEKEKAQAIAMQEETKLKEMVSRKVYCDGILMNKILIMRKGVCFGEFGMVLSIYGMGIAGRVYMEKHRFPRHLSFEAYCPKLRATYSLRVNLDQLEELLQQEENKKLLNPGHKRELCDYLIQLVWFDESSLQLKINANVPKDANTAFLRRKFRMEEAKMRQAKLDSITRKSNGEDVFLDANGKKKRNRKKSRNLKPWKRLNGLIYSVGKNLCGFFLIVTVHVQPRRRGTFVVRAYDPESSKYFEILVAARELATLLNEKQDPELWNIEKRKQICKDMVDRLLSLQRVGITKGEMALAIGSRCGIALPCLFDTKLERKRRHGVALVGGGENTFFSIESISQLQALAKRPNARKSVVLFQQTNDTVLNGKLPRRDIGQGILLKRFIATISDEKCIISIYERNKSCSFGCSIYILRNSNTFHLKMSSEQLEILTKHDPTLFTYLSSDDVDEKLLLFQYILNERISLDINSNYKPKLDKEIYCRGHKLKDFRKINNNNNNNMDTNKNQQYPFSYCIVTIYQTPEELEFSIFEKSSCQTYSFHLEEEESKATMLEFKMFDHLKREIHLSVLSQSLCLEHDNDNQKTIIGMMEDFK